MYDLSGKGAVVTGASRGIGLHVARLPGRTLVRDLDVWGTNPFPP